MALNPKDFMVIGSSGSRVVRVPGSIGGQDFVLDGLSDCTVLLMDRIEQVQADDIKDSTLLIGPVNGSFFMRNCINVRVSVCCRQFRSRDCRDCHVYLYCATKAPVIETSYNMHFHPYDLAFPGLSSAFASFGFDAAVNYGLEIFDFSASDDSIPQPHSIAHKEIPSMRKIRVEQDKEGKKLGEPDTPLEGLIPYTSSSEEHIDSIRLGRFEPGQQAADSQGDSAIPPPALSPRLTDLADRILESALLDDPLPLPVAAPSTASSTIHTLMANKATHNNTAAAATAGTGAVESKDYSFTFFITQLEAQSVVDANEILASMAEYGTQKRRNSVPETAPSNANGEEKSAAVQATPKKAAGGMDSLWADLVSSEAKPTEKERLKKERERQQEEAVKQKFMEEEEKIRLANIAFENAGRPADPSASAAEPLEAAEAARQLKRLEDERQRAIDEKLQAATADLTAIAEFAEADHMANRELRAQLRADAMRIIKETEATTGASRLGTWSDVLALIPAASLALPDAEARLAQLKHYYNKSADLHKKKADQANHSNPIQASSHSSPAPIPVVDPSDPLSVLLSSLDCLSFLPRFTSELLCVDSLVLLERDDLSALVDKLGPRKKLEQWIRNERKQKNMELGSLSFASLRPPRSSMHSMNGFEMRSYETFPGVPLPCHAIQSQRSAMGTQEEKKSPKVLFLHGLESGPGGKKCRYLSQHFPRLSLPSLSPTLIVPLALWKAIREITKFQPDVLVGSSYGGFLALFLIQCGVYRGPCILLAPATGLFFRRLLCLPPAYPLDRLIIVHSNDDTVVPIQDSIALFQSVANGVGRLRFIRPSGDHSLNAFCLDEHRLAPLIVEHAQTMKNNNTPALRYNAGMCGDAANDEGCLQWCLDLSVTCLLWVYCCLFLIRCFVCEPWTSIISIYKIKVSHRLKSS